MFVSLYIVNTKAVAAILAGIIILSVVFFYFNVSYPTGPLSLNPPPVKNPKVFKLGYLFDPQYAEPPSISGMSFGTGPSAVTNFTLTQNGTTHITGKFYNQSSGKAIADSNFYVFAYPVYTAGTTAYNGSYSVKVLVYGEMNLTFVVPGYQKDIVPLNLNGGTLHLNLTLKTEPKINWAGSTVSSIGINLPNVTIEADGFFTGLHIFSSDAKSAFTANLFEDSYQLNVILTGYDNIPTPPELNLTNKLQQNLVLTPLNNTYNLTGYVLDKANSTAISNAEVYVQQTNAVAFTNSTGYYRVPVINGMNRLTASHSGFYTNISLIDISGAPSNLHYIYLYPVNPYINNNTGYYGNNSRVPQLNGNNSTLNLSNSGSFEMTGQVLVNNTAIPVSNTTLLFLLTYNGSVYYDRVITNSTGYFVTYFAYSGDYRLLVEAVNFKNLMLNVTITKQLTYENFSLVPLSNRTVIITGQVFNTKDGLPVQGAHVAAMYSRFAISAANVTTNSTGYYRMALIAGNYSLIASDIGYQTNRTSQFTLNSNLSKDVNLTPLSTINGGGNRSGLKAMGSAPYYGLPDLTPAQIAQDLSGNGAINSGTTFNITFHFNTSAGFSISGTPYVVYFKVLGKVYYSNGTTNATGFGTVNGIPDGTYEILPEMFYFFGQLENISVSSAVTYWLSMSEKQLLPGNAYLKNTFNLTNGMNGSVPLNTLALTDSILPMNGTAAALSNSTLFSFSGYNGIFSFNYTNPDFVWKDFNISFNASGVKTGENVTEYSVTLISQTVTPWAYNYRNSIATSLNVSMASGNSTVFIESAAGYSVLTVGIPLGVPNSVGVRSIILTLTSGNPEQMAYFNETSSNLSLPLNGTSLSGTQFSMSYSGPASANNYLYSIILPFQVPYNSSVYVNGAKQSGQISYSGNNTVFNLTTYVTLHSSINITVEFNVSKTSPITLKFSPANLEFYRMSLS